MLQLPSLKIADTCETRFILFDDLKNLWMETRGVNTGSDRSGDHDSSVNRDKSSAGIREKHLEFTGDGNMAEDAPVLLIVDANVRNSHGEMLKQVFPGKSTRYFEVPPGEESKNVATWNRIIDFAFSGPLRRNTPLVAVGGGVTGDLAGFAASGLMRGLPLYHVPTTLLAMVDSAIGGKTGINHAFGKNTIGAFYHPEAVLFDTAFLNTLPQREWLCGISEVLKYGYIADPRLLDQATALADPASRSQTLLEGVIKQSVQIKSKVVADDARESGKRAWLNFGHTFAHALETQDNYCNINHGEAVYAGMIAALFVSRKLGYNVSDEPLMALKDSYQLDLGGYTSAVDRLVTLMTQDKKNRDNSIRLVLVKDHGRPCVHPVNNRNLLREAWQYTFRALS